MTPNYDLLAEEALERIGLNYRYRAIDAVMQDNILSIYNALPIHASSGHRRRNAVSELKLRHAVPVLVTYGPGKDATHGRPHLDRVRRECAAELRETPPVRIIALGISPPRRDGDDDAWESLCKLLGSLDAKKEYWSCVHDECDRMQAYGFEAHTGYFEQLLDSLEN